MARDYPRPNRPKGYPTCACGCGRKRGLQLHHVVYRQEIRRNVPKAAVGPPDLIAEVALLGDQRNLLPVGPKCHASHHDRSHPFDLSILPDSAFDFASELLGAGAAYEYLSRRYRGGDDRLDALLTRYQNEECSDGRAA